MKAIVKLLTILARVHSGVPNKSVCPKSDKCFRCRSFPCLPSTDVLAYMEEILAMSDISDDELDKTNDESAMDWQSSLNDDWETVVASDVKRSERLRHIHVFQ